MLKAEIIEYQQKFAEILETAEADSKINEQTFFSLEKEISQIEYNVKALNAAKKQFSSDTPTWQKFDNSIVMWKMRLARCNADIKPLGEQIENSNMRLLGLKGISLAIGNLACESISCIEDLDKHWQAAVDYEKLSSDKVFTAERKLLIELARVIARYVTDFYHVRLTAEWFIAYAKANPNRGGEILNHFRDCFDILARGFDFDCYLIANEWNRQRRSKFYEPRRKVLLRHNVVQDLQALQDGVVLKHVQEAPVGAGKSTIGINFVCARAGWAIMKGVYPRILVGNAVGGLTKGFFNDIVSYLTDNEYRWKEIFKFTLPIITDAEQYSVCFEKKQREPNILCRSIEVGATGLIHLNKEGLLYMDDLIKNSEEAKNEDFLQKRYEFYTSSFKDRKENEFVPELHIGTPWASGDPLDKIIKKHKNPETIRVNAIPCYYINEQGQKITNFDYEGEHYKSVEHWDELIDEEDDKFISDAKFFMQPRKREGTMFNSFLYFTKEELKQQLSKEKPFRTSATDVATSEATMKKKADFLASGYFYVFESIKEIWMVDVLYTDKGIDYSMPEIVNRHIDYGVERSEIEEKEGKVSGEVQFGVGHTIKKAAEARNRNKCNIQVHSGAGLKSKANRIDMAANAIRGKSIPIYDEDMQTKISEGYIYRFLHPDERQTNTEYNLAMKHLQSYMPNSEEFPDDMADMLAMNLAYCVDGKKPTAKIRVFSRKQLGR